MAVSSLLSLAVALASAPASARSCVVQCPELPASCSPCTSPGPLWALSLSTFYDEVPEDLHQGDLKGFLGDLLAKFFQGHSITIEFWALLTEFSKWAAPSTPGEAPRPNGQLIRPWGSAGEGGSATGVGPR